MKLIQILFFTLISLPLFSQEIKDSVLREINDRGELFTKSIKNGEIETLKNTKPPRNTWVYSKLEEYKKNIGSKDVIYGSVILPSKENNFYSYNLFAYDNKKKFYYFVAIVSYKIDGENIELSNSYLFTEKIALVDWWKSVYGFYESDEKNEIPQEYLFDTCPPPPFLK